MERVLMIIGVVFLVLLDGWYMFRLKPKRSRAA